MAKELKVAYTAATTCRAILRKPDNTVYQTTTTTWVTYVNANRANYLITLAETDSDGVYVGDFPASSPAGLYSVEYLVTPYAIANRIGGGSIPYNGSTLDFQSGDNYARLGAPAGASIAADIATKVGQADLILSNPTAGTVGEALYGLEQRVGRRATAQAGTGTTITLDASASATDNLYRGHEIKIVSGTGSGQHATILSYVGSTKVATIGRKGNPSLGWDTNPDATSVFLTTPQPLFNIGMWEGVVPNALIAGRVDSNTQDTAATLTFNRTGNLSGSVGSVTAGVTVTTNNDKTGYSLTQAFPANFSSLGISVAGKINGVVLTDTLTTYTGNTLQTGDSFVRIGSTGSGLTSLAPSATALSNVQWTNARAALQDNLDAAVSSRMATFTYVAPDNTTLGYLNGLLNAGHTAFTATALANAPTGGGGGSGASLAQIDATLDARNLTTAYINATIGSRMATYVQPTGFLAATFPATVSSFAGGAVASVTGSVGSIASGGITSASFAAGAITAIQSGLATSANQTTINNNIIAVGSTVDSIKVVTDRVNTALVLDGGVYQFTANALELAPTGGGGSGPTAGQIADAVWDEILSGHLIVGSAGAALSAAGVAGDPLTGTIESGVNLKQAIMMMLSFMFGNTTGGGTDVINFMDVNNQKIRLIMGVDANTNRLYVTRDLT